MAGPVLVVAPHPDDETLGCGGTLLRLKAEGHSIHWLIVTGMEKGVYSQERIDSRNSEIAKIHEMFGFSSKHLLGIPAAKVDTIPQGELTEKMKRVFSEVKPETVLLPFEGDVHTDHRAVFAAGLACSKWFRSPHVKRVWIYETPSETDLGQGGFNPNLFVDVSKYLDKKIEIMKCYAGEMGTFPFPRSEESLRAYATVRGAASGFGSAEAFMTIRERI